MDSIFYSLLDNSIAEVLGREPEYPRLFPLAIHPRQMFSLASQFSLASKVPPRTIEQALIEGLEYITTRWPQSGATSAADNALDPIGQFLCGCILDSLCAARGVLGLRPHQRFSGSVREVLTKQYIPRSTAEGVRYHIRDGGGRPILLIHATGTPMDVWAQFLSDTSHNFRVIVPERRGSDLYQGRLQQHVTIERDAADLISILDAEALDRVDILGWCNGARVAIHLANSRIGQISSLVLLGPMLKGVRGVVASPSNFERDLQPLLDAVHKDPSLAPFLARTIACQPASPDWSRWQNAPVGRAQALFAMPAKDHAAGMIANLVEPQSFANIARRVASDESYPMAKALAGLQLPIMVIMGSDDSIVSNALVTAAMKQMCTNPVVKVVVSATGHYIQDLQYQYFRWLLEEFLITQCAPPATGRIAVEHLTTAQVSNCSVLTVS